MPAEPHRREEYPWRSRRARTVHFPAKSLAGRFRSGLGATPPMGGPPTGQRISGNGPDGAREQGAWPLRSGAAGTGRSGRPIPWQSGTPTASSRPDHLLGQHVPVSAAARRRRSPSRPGKRAFGRARRPCVPPRQKALGAAAAASRAPGRGRRVGGSWVNCDEGDHGRRPREGPRSPDAQAASKKRILYPPSWGGLPARGQPDRSGRTARPNNPGESADRCANRRRRGRRSPQVNTSLRYQTPSRSRASCGNGGNVCAVIGCPGTALGWQRNVRSERWMLDN
jgi:hypothetical protein